MFEIAVDDADYPQILLPGARPAAADAAHDQIDLHPGVGGAVDQTDHALVGKAVHLGDDPPLAAGADAGDLALDQRLEFFPHAERRHDEPVPLFRRSGVPRQHVEEHRHVGPELVVAAQEPQIGVELGRPLVVVAGAEVDVAPDALRFAADDQQRLAVDLQVGDAVDHAGPRLVEFPRPGDVAAFVETRLELHDRRDLLAVFGGAAQRPHDGRIVAHAVERLLDREHAGIFRRPFQKRHQSTEILIRRGDQDRTAIFDRAKRVGGSGKLRHRHRRPRGFRQSGGVRRRRELDELREAQRPPDEVDALRSDFEFAQKPLEQPAARPARYFQPHDSVAPPPHKLSADVLREVVETAAVRLVLHVARQPEGETLLHLRTGEEKIQIVRHQFLERHEGALRSG